MKTYDRFKEYIWIVKTISQENGITLAELNRRWVKTELSGGVPFVRSTFYRYRCAIEDIFGVAIECDLSRGNVYYINNKKVLNGNSIQNWMLSTLSVSNLLDESRDLHDRILLENIPSGSVHLYQVIKAMREGRRISMTYLRYSRTEEKTYTVEPYCMKLFRQRWYMVGKLENGHLSTFSFDRIGNIEVLDERFEMDKDFRADEFFADSYGIMVDERVPRQRIVLRAYGYEQYYMRDLPLHHSQREIATTDEYCDFELELRPTPDFKSKLVSRCEWLRVLEPKELADEIVEWHRKAIRGLPPTPPEGEGRRIRPAGLM